MLGLPFLRLVALLVLFSLRLSKGLYNATINSTAPQIVWSPAVCNVSVNITNCNSAWRILDDIPGMLVTSTTGPLNSGGILPQMFLSFRGEAIYIRSSSLSTAIANISISSQSEAVRFMQFDSSLGVISAVDLPRNGTVTYILAITYVPDSGRLDIQSIILSVADTSATSSYLPSNSLPSSSAPPIFTPSPTTQHTSSHKGTILAASLGSSIGVLLLVSAGVGVVYWRRRKKRQRMAASTTWRNMRRGIGRGRGRGRGQRTAGAPTKMWF